MKNHQTVLIVGAGPTGLMLGVMLAAGGVPFRLIDKRKERGTGTRAYLLHSRTLELLDGLGLADEFLKAGHEVRRIVLLQEGKALERVRFDRLESAFPFSVAMGQGLIEEILEGALKKLGGRVEWGAELMDARLKAGGTAGLGGVWAKVRDAEHVIEADEYFCVAACDGAASSVRHCLEPGYFEETWSESFAVGDVALKRAEPEGEAWLCQSEEGFVFVCPIGGGLWRVTSRIGMQQARTGVDSEELAELVNRRSGGKACVDAVRNAGVYTVQRRMSERWRIRGVFFLGAAACVHHPLTCQGLNAGMQDAVNLGWKLLLACKQKGAPDLTESYAAERQPVAEELALTDERLLRLAQRGGQVSLTENLLGKITGLPPINAALARDVAGLSIHYRRGPLTVEARGSFETRSQMRAGERVPDFGISLTDGTPQRMKNLMRGKGPGSGSFHLFVAPGNAKPHGRGSFGEARRLVEEVQVDFGEWVRTHWLLTPAQSMALRDELPEHLVDLAGEGIHYLGIEPYGVALVRPDFYSCYAARDFDSGAMRLAYLRFLA